MKRFYYSCSRRNSNRFLALQHILEFWIIFTQHKFTPCMIYKRQRTRYSSTRCLCDMFVHRLEASVFRNQWLLLKLVVWSAQSIFDFASYFFTWVWKLSYLNDWQCLFALLWFCWHETICTHLTMRLFLRSTSLMSMITNRIAWISVQLNIQSARQWVKTRE